MKLSQLNVDEMNITDEQLESIVFDGVTDEVVESTVAFVLGCDPIRAIERAKMAAHFYQKGGTKTLIVTGGVKYDYNGEKLSESEIMRRALINEDVPSDAIIMENRARYTSENMIFSFPEAVWIYGETGVKSVTVITSPSHLRRSVGLAKYFLPAGIAVHGYTEGIKEYIRDYKTDPDLNLATRNEVCWLQLNIKRGWESDIEF